MNKSSQSQPQEFFRIAKFTRRDWIAGGSFGALSAVVTVVFGYALGQALGPGMSIINALLGAIVIALGMLIVGKFGTGLLIFVVTSILVIPTPQLGPPGPQKILMGIGLGLILDVVFYTLRKRPMIGIIIATAVMDFCYAWLLLAVVTIFGLEAEKFVSLAPKLAITGLAIGAIGGLIAFQIWKRLLKRGVTLQ